MTPWGKKDQTMIVTTTPSVEGYQIAEYKGIVTGEAIMGANVFRDVFAQITDIIGGRSGAYEAKLGEARETALNELQERARALGATAVVGVDLDYEVINNMLMVSASGTAVVLG
jgi:uncharacterized protein YbjQ (UPF0145 family)